MHIGFVTQWYPPEQGTQIPQNIAQKLSEAGHEVTVLTGVPNYPYGRVYAGYSLRKYSRETLNGIPVHRVALYPSHDRHSVGRIANYLSFAITSSFYIQSALEGVDVCLVYSSPITAALPALLLHARQRVPYVLLVQDMWPQSLGASGMLPGRLNGPAERVLHRICDTIYRAAAKIAVTSPGMEQMITQRGIPRQKVAFLPNWADEQSYYPTSADEDLKCDLGISRPFTVMYAGNLGLAQGLDIVVDAASLLSDRSNLGFTLVGQGAAEASLRMEVNRRRLDNVKFVPPQPSNRMAAVLAAAQVQLVSLRPDALYARTLPSKIQTLLAAGRPILAAVEGDAAEIIEKSGAGITAKPGSAADLATAIDLLVGLSREELHRMGVAGRAYYLQHFAERVVVSRLEAMLADAVESSQMSPQP